MNNEYVTAAMQIYDFLCHTIFLYIYPLSIQLSHCYIYLQRFYTVQSYLLLSSCILRLMLYTQTAVYIKKSVTMHTPGRVQILTITLTLTLTLAVYHASFVYTYGWPCV